MADPGVYLRLVRAQVRAQTQYRASFLGDLVSSTLFMTLDIVAVLVLFRATRVLGGFGIREAFLFAALGGLAFATADLTVGTIERLPYYVRYGQLEAMLVRPRRVLPQLLVADVAVRRVGEVVQGVAVLALACRLVHVDWTPARALLVVLAPLCGAGFFAAIFVAGSTLAFYWTESGEFANAFTYGGRNFTSYPVSVYSGLFRRIFAYGLGFAFVAYYPGLVLLGRADPLGGPAWLGWICPAVCAAAVAAATLAWRTGIRHYRGTGS